MKPFHIAAIRPVAAIALALLVGAGLAGCGSSNDDHGNDGGGTSPPPVPVLDAFFLTVSGFVASSPDTTEATLIETLVATAPENTEPASID